MSILMLDNLWRQHMSNYSYVVVETTACPTIWVHDRRVSMIDNGHHKHVVGVIAFTTAVGVILARQLAENILFASLTRRAFVAGAPNQTAP